MFRYFAIFYDPEDSDSSHRASALLSSGTMSGQWLPALTFDGGALLVTSTDCPKSNLYLLDRSAGAIVGTLFLARRANQAVGNCNRIDEEETAAIVATQGRALVSHYWGRYVAIIRDMRARIVRVIRDPQGGIPCFFTTVDRLTVVFSEIDDCYAFGLGPFDTNWSYVAACVASRYPSGTDCGYRGVTEVVEGQCIEVGSDGQVRSKMYWDPSSFARRALESEQSAAEQLRCITEQCVSAWCSGHEAIVHEYSGGLDSSIVLSCLRSAPTSPRLKCVNHYSAASFMGDERAYARLGASQAGCDLCEVEDEVETVDLYRLLRMPRRARPAYIQGPLQREDIQRRVAQEFGASAISSGFGGDQILFCGPAATAAADCLRQHGARTRFLKYCSKVAQAERRVIWSVLSSANSINALPASRWADAVLNSNSCSNLVPREVIEEWRERQSRTIHPWLASAMDLPPGKLQHIRYLMSAPTFSTPFTQPGDPERIAPLVSQPLIELCLQIPTYVLLSNGVNRALARRAFSDSVPRELINRTCKGAIDDSMWRLMERNLQFIREFILDGILVRERLLDRTKLESLLSNGAPPPSQRDISELMLQQLCNEAWSRQFAPSGRTAQRGGCLPYIERGRDVRRTN